jgi:hypothetical protein
MEKWKRIKDAPRLEVSNMGRIRWRAVTIGETALLNVIRRQQTAANGAKYIPDRSAGAQKNLYIHRLVAAAFLPKPKNKTRTEARVGWKDGDKQNNRAANLFYY